MPNDHQIDALVKFLPRFSADGFTSGRVNASPNQFPWFEYDPAVMEFLDALYANGWVDPAFNWVVWQDEAARYVEQPERIGTASVETVQRLLMTHARKERFCEGHLAEMLECGHITALLRRLEVIRGQPQGG